MSFCEELVDIETRARRSREEAIPEIQKLQQSILDNDTIASNAKDSFNYVEIPKDIWNSIETN